MWKDFYVSDFDTVDVAVLEANNKVQSLYANLLSQVNAMKDRVFPRFGLSPLSIDSGMEATSVANISLTYDNPYTIIRRLFNLITWYIIIVLSIGWINTYNEYGVCNVEKGSYYKIDAASLGTKGQCLKTQYKNSKSTVQVI